MKTFHKLTSLAAVFAAFALHSVSAAVENGQPAPNFTLQSIDGKTHSLSDFKGKTVVLEWHNPDCPIVKRHYDSGNLPKTQQEATGQGVVWLTINSGAPGQQGADYSDAELNEYFQKHGTKQTAYFRDQDGKVGRLYGAKTTPHMYIIDPNGTLVYQGGIDNAPSAKSKEDMAKATNYVTESLAALKAGQAVPNPATKPYGCSVKYGKS